MMPYTVGPWNRDAKRYEILFNGKFHDFGPLIWVEAHQVESYAVRPPEFSLKLTREKVAECNARYNKLKR